MAKLAFAHRPMRPLGRPVEPSSTPAQPNTGAKMKAAPEAPCKATATNPESLPKTGANSRATRPSLTIKPCHTAADDYDIIATLKRIGLSRSRAAQLIGVWKSTVDDWCAGTEVPQYGRTILDLIEHCAPARERLEAKHPRQAKPRDKHQDRCGGGI
jgi:hypothetical protein